MPTWVVVLVNGVLLAYCVVMLIVGHIKKKKKIAQAKEELKKEYENEQRETSQKTEQETH